MMTAMTLGELITLYTRTPVFDSLSTSTRRAYLAEYKRLLPFYPKEVGKITKLDVAKIHSQLGRGSANIFKAAVGSLCHFGVSLTVVKEDWSQSLPVRGGSVPIGTWDLEELRGYFALAPHNPIALAMAISFFTVQRLSDVVKIKWEDIKDGIIHIQQQKTKKVLKVPVHAELDKILNLIPKGDGYVLSKSDGTKYSAPAIQKRYRDLVPKSKPSFHGIRKAACKALAEGGCSAHEIMSLSGHTTLGMVQLYTQEVEQVKMAKGAMEKMKC